MVASKNKASNGTSLCGCVHDAAGILVLAVSLLVTTPCKAMIFVNFNSRQHSFEMTLPPVTQPKKSDISGCHLGT